MEAAQNLILVTKMMISHFNRLIFLVLLCLISFKLSAIHLLIPMDEEGQKEHLKAYGIAYYAIERGLKFSNKNMFSNLLKTVY